MFVGTRAQQAENFLYGGWMNNDLAEFWWPLDVLIVGRDGQEMQKPPCPPPWGMPDAADGPPVAGGAASSSTDGWQQGGWKQDEWKQDEKNDGKPDEWKQDDWKHDDWKSGGWSQQKQGGWRYAGWNSQGGWGQR